MGKQKRRAFLERQRRKPGTIVLTQEEHQWLITALLTLCLQENGPKCQGKDDILHHIFDKLDSTRFYEDERKIE